MVKINKENYMLIIRKEHGGKEVKLLINRRHKIYEQIKELEFETEMLLTKIYELNAELNRIADGGTYVDATTQEVVEHYQYKIKVYQCRIADIDKKKAKLYRKVR